MSVVPPDLAIGVSTLLASVDAAFPAEFESAAQQDMSLLPTLALVAALGYGVTKMMDPVDGNQPLAKPAKKSTFGWLHADLRMPLPTLEQLDDACHLIGTQDGRQKYLCKDGPAKSSFTDCEVSDDFSTYYGDQIYVCTGGEAQSTRYEEVQRAL
jgi:hypothetical protein